MNFSQFKAIYLLNQIKAETMASHAGLRLAEILMMEILIDQQTDLDFIESLTTNEGK